MSLLSVALLLLAFLLAYNKKRRHISGRQLPPGPSPTLILGNIRGLDGRNPWKTYTKWAEEYGRAHQRVEKLRLISSFHPGEIIYTQLLGQDIIVISSERVAHDLLDRRSQNYSSRPASLIPINQL